jgi:hypothetical protein
MAFRHHEGRMNVQYLYSLVFWRVASVVTSLAFPGPIKYTVCIDVSSNGRCNHLSETTQAREKNDKNKYSEYIPIN